MGYSVNKKQLNEFLNALKDEYDIYAPKRFVGGNTFADVDCVRYAKVDSAEEIEFGAKSEYSYKEALTPVSQTLFFFTEQQTKEADAAKKGAVIFLRNCDIYALQSLDDIYLKNGEPDYYYEQRRGNIKLVLMGCDKSFENCFCVSMGSNKADNYDLAINAVGEDFELDSKDEKFTEILDGMEVSQKAVQPAYVTQNEVTVTIPAEVPLEMITSPIWDEYDTRCINCGRCTLVCPTCTCYTMQDLSYSEDGRAGERRRVGASCMIDGFTDVAGGGSYRKKNGERMRYKVLHKVWNHRRRFGRNMCVGCGRCDDSCPEYISYSNSINRLNNAVKEANENDA